MLCALVAQMCDAGWPAMPACAPLTSPLCFLLPYPTHASGSLLILQLVSDWLAALHVVYVMCPIFFHCVLLAGNAGMCPSDYTEMFLFALPHACIWIPPISAASE
jgi:hypothetical protein